MGNNMFKHKNKKLNSHLVVVAKTFIIVHIFSYSGCRQEYSKTIDAGYFYKLCHKYTILLAQIRQKSYSGISVILTY